MRTFPDAVWSDAISTYAIWHRPFCLSLTKLCSSPRSSCMGWDTQSLSHFILVRVSYLVSSRSSGGLAMGASGQFLACSAIEDGKVVLDF